MTVKQEVNSPIDKNEPKASIKDNFFNFMSQLWTWISKSNLRIGIAIILSPLIAAFALAAMLLILGLKFIESSLYYAGKALFGDDDYKKMQEDKLQKESPYYKQAKEIHKKIEELLNDNQKMLIGGQNEAEKNLFVAEFRKPTSLFNQLKTQIGKYEANPQQQELQDLQDVVQGIRDFCQQYKENPLCKEFIENLFSIKQQSKIGADTPDITLPPK